MLKRQILMLIPVLITALLTGCVAKNVVVRVPQNGEGPKRDGVFYALPRTAIDTKTTVVKVEKTPGKYWKYAACFFPDEDPILEKTTSFVLGDSTIDSHGEPDPKEIFMVKIKGRYLEDKNLDLALTEAGTMVKGKAETTNRTLDVALQTAQTAVSLAAQAGAFDTASSAQPLVLVVEGIETIPDSSLREHNELENFLLTAGAACGDKNKILTAVKEWRAASAASKKFPEELQEEKSALEELRKKEAEEKNANRKKDIAAKAQEKVDRVADLQRNQTTTVNNFKLNHRALLTEFLEAYRIYKRILELQKDLEELLSPTPRETSAEAIRLKLDETTKLIARYKNDFFLGNTKKTATTLSFEIPPATPEPLQADVEQVFPLFKFSPNRGVCEMLVNDQGPYDLSNAFRSIKVCPDGRANCSKAVKVEAPCSPEEVKLVSLKIKRLQDAIVKQITDRTQKTNDRDERGFYYRIPALSLARIVLGDNEELHRFKLPVAQLGLTASLPVSTGGRSTSYTLALYEKTGAMQNFILGSNGLIERSTVTDAGAVAGTVIDARAKAAEARGTRAAAASDSAQATRLADLLEDCARIKKAQEDLGVPVKLPKYCQP